MELDVGKALPLGAGEGREPEEADRWWFERSLVEESVGVET